MAKPTSSLTNGTLQISINVSNISDKLPPEVIKRLSGFSTKLEIPFFKTQASRDTSTQAEFAKEIDILRKFVEDKFPSVFINGYASELAQHAMAYVYYGIPSLQPGSKLFRQMSSFMIFGFLTDDMMDKDQTEFLSEDYRIPVEDLNKAWETIVKVLRRLGIRDGGVMQRVRTKPPNRAGKLLFSILHLGFPLLKRSHRSWVRCWNLIERLLSLIHQEGEVKAHKALIIHPFVYRLFAGLMDFISGSWISTADTIQMMYAMIPMMVTNSWANVHMRGGTPGQTTTFSQETYRFMRAEDTGLFFFVDTYYLLSHGYLPPSVYHSTQLRHFQILASCIFASLNDILGFEKDVRLGEIGSMVMFKVLNGGEDTVGDILKTEADALGTYVTDYLWFRTHLLEVYGEDVAKYVETVDGTLNGCVVAFMHSKRYAMGGKKIHFEEEASPSQKE